MYVALLVKSIVHTYDAGLEAIFDADPHKAPLTAHPPPPPPPRAPIIILPRPDPLGNEDGPGGEYDGGILANSVA